jgi:FkbM family methyltransferase
MKDIFAFPRSIARRAFVSLGVDVRRVRNLPLNPLVYHGVDLLLDVGANTGQYVRSARASGYLGKVVSFEPLPDAHRQLIDCARSDPDWLVHPRCAIGASRGQSQINVSGNSYSSSLLPMLGSHETAAPDSTYISQVDVEVVPLDTVYRRYKGNAKRVCLKIDTQGYEARVLQGGQEALRDVGCVQLEMSIVPLYAGQELYQYFFDFFRERGFFLWSVVPGFFERHSGRLLQFDATFVSAAWLSED